MTKYMNFKSSLYVSYYQNWWKEEDVSTWEEWGVNDFDKRNVCTGQRGKAVNAHGQSATAAAAASTAAA